MASSRSEENVNLRHFPTQAGVTVLVSPAILLDSCDFLLLWQMFKPLLYGIMMLFGRCYCLIAMLMQLFFVWLMSAISKFDSVLEKNQPIYKENLVHRFLPKQTDINKILNVIQRKVLKGTHLPVEIKEIQVGYLHSPYFKDLYLYLLQNRLPSSKSAIRKLEILSEKYVLLDLLLFRISPEKETAVLAIPETCTDMIITLYHKGLFAGHQGVIKTYWTISDTFFIPNLIHYLRSCIKSCHICQLTRNEKPPSRHLQARNNPNYVPMSRLSMDLKVMPKSHKLHRYILCIIDEVTNFLVTVPIFQARSEEIGEALLENIITKYCIPEYIIMDQDSAFMSSLMMYLFLRLNIKIKMIVRYNHQSLQVEHGIKSLTCN